MAVNCIVCDGPGDVQTAVGVMHKAANLMKPGLYSAPVWVRPMQVLSCCCAPARSPLKM